MKFYVSALRCLFAEGGSEKGSNASDTGPDVIEEGEADENSENDKAPTTYYDKSSSFFDRISCEALEKQDGYVIEVLLTFLM